jgi:hypothetical protein
MSQDQTPRPTRQPEKKIGPFSGGISVAIWLNTAETQDGPRVFRSITVSPRRYLDRESGEWKDASSYNPGDLPALIYALQKAQEFVFETPLPDQKNGESPKQPEEIPF